jgi:gag-polypeptide of LTR copia-type
MRTMSNEFKIRITKLAADGANWVTYYDQIMWSLDVKGLLEHLMSDMIMSDYSAARTVNRLSPEVQWKRNKAMVKQLITGLVPDTVFTHIKAVKAKEVWDQLWVLYEGWLKLILVDLCKWLQNTHCGADDDLHAHFNKLADLKEQLAAMGATIMDEEYANVLLGSLPEAYSNAMNSIMAAVDISGKLITPSLVIWLITDEYDWWSLNKGKGK